VTTKATREALQIPVRDSAHNEVVEVRIDELPDDASPIVGVLRNERATLALWLAFAVEYYRYVSINRITIIASMLNLYAVDVAMSTLFCCCCALRTNKALSMHSNRRLASHLQMKVSNAND
jgi:hypothetical protein